MAKFSIGVLVGMLLMGAVYQAFPGGVGDAARYFGEQITEIVSSSP